MALYLLACDLQKTERDHVALARRLASLNAVRTLDAVWLVEVSMSAASLRDVVMAHVGDNDRIFVAELTPAADWAHLNSIALKPWMTAA